MKHRNQIYIEHIPDKATAEDFSLEISKAILFSLKKRLLLTSDQVEQCIEIIEKDYRKQSRD